MASMESWEDERWKGDGGKGHMEECWRQGRDIIMTIATVLKTWEEHEGEGETALKVEKVRNEAERSWEARRGELEQTKQKEEGSEMKSWEINKAIVSRGCVYLYAFYGHLIFSVYVIVTVLDELDWQLRRLGLIVFNTSHINV